MTAPPGAHGNGNGTRWLAIILFAAGILSASAALTLHGYRDYPAEAGCAIAAFVLIAAGLAVAFGPRRQS